MLSQLLPSYPRFISPAIVPSPSYSLVLLRRPGIPEEKLIERYSSVGTVWNV